MIVRFVERILYASRWLLVPLYLGMSIALLVLTIKFFQELYHTLWHILEISETDIVLRLLELIDLVLIGSLVIMVAFSSYENMVSQLEINIEDSDRLSWLGKHDYGDLKLKVAVSIVAISSIHLLKVFMNAERTPNDKIMWYVFVHLTLVVSALLMVLSDRIKGKH